MEAKEIHPIGKKKALIKFILVLVVILIYFAFMIFEYGFSQGISATILTWSFFVFCTPIAFAGFLLDFPIRLITNLKMLYSEMMVWVICIIMNTIYMIYNPAIYELNTFLHLFKYILTHAYPYWIIILLSFTGTFLSIIFADEILDKYTDRKHFKKHHWKHKFLALASITILIVLSYYILITKLGITI